MLSKSPTTLARSSLEVMLENLRCQDEKPRDLPPALPSRPTSKARLPSARRSLPVNFKVNEKQIVGEVKEVKRKSDFGRETKISTFGRKKIKSDQLYENTPYSSPNSQEAGGRSGAVSAVASTSRPAVDCDDKIGYFIKKKLRVWCRQPSQKWECGIIQSIDGNEASVRLSAGKVVKTSTGDLLPANPDLLDSVHDLIQLSYLNEPSVLHTLQHRYLNNMIYSKAGPVLISVNPFKDLQIYGSNFISSYREKLANGPHVYAVADAAYDEMMKVGVNQSIILSGESGAGKTETAKFAMQYLASLGGGGDGIENKILHTSCILEAFGNAKTSRNNNSSRFGKLIEIHFSTVGTLCGAVIQTFLIEKSRVVQLAKGERSFHVFYQLCAGASSVLRDKLNIKTPSHYYYLNQSDCLTIGGVDDADRYCKLMEALDIVQINKKDQESMLSILATILWLGNIKFEVIDNDDHVQVVIDEAVTSAAKLMGCSVQDLTQVLSADNSKAGKDGIIKNLTLQQAMDARDALAKFIYARLFDWLVNQINKSLAFDKCYSGRAISILDMYGFESFQRNCFEQFCINYANERLQQHFYRHLFKLEQEEYEADGIDWIKVDFEDNQDCLNLFEKTPLGLLSLLDEESNFPSATDLTFTDKLKQRLSSNPCFKGGEDGRFCIRHYAQEILYDTAGFLEKNRDPEPSESILALLSRSAPLLQSIASGNLNQSQESMDTAQYGMLDVPKQGVGTKFKDQMYRLMQHLENTTPHFICCMKPNHKQLPGVYETDLVAHQLRSCGVLEVVRMARSNYPSRITHQDFAQRFGFLLLDKSVPQDPLNISFAVLHQYNILPEMYQVGYTKLYFRTAQVGGLENTRKRVLQSVVEVQKCFRGYKARCQYHEFKRRVATLQSFIRGQTTRREYTSLSKKHKASANIQNHKHKHSVPKANKQQKAAVELQSAIRGALAQRQLNNIQSLGCSNLEGPDADEKPTNNVTEAKVPSSVVAELQRQLVKAESKAEATLEQKEEEHLDSTQKDNHDLRLALDELKRRLEKTEATLEQKEVENAALKVQLQKYESQWSEYDGKMRSMEEMWQKQIKSLQASLTTAKNSLATENGSDQPGRPESSLSPSPSPCYFDSDDNFSPLDRTPDASTPIILSSIPMSEAATGGREANGTSNPVNNLAKEFEQKRNGFDEDAKAILDINKTGSHPEDELKRLKMRFAVWKKEYKGRLRETKGMLQKQGNADSERKGRKWWSKKRDKGHPAEPRKDRPEMV